MMGQYPAFIDARQDEQGTWQATNSDFRPADRAVRYFRHLFGR